MINWKSVLLTALGAGVVSAVVFSLRIPDDADYCNVALIPELADELETDLVTQILLASKGKALVAALTGGVGHPLPEQARKIADETGPREIDQCGRHVKALLTIEQRKAFYRLFRSGKVRAVTYRTKAGKGRFDPAQFLLTFGWSEMKEEDRVPTPYQLKKKLEGVYERIPSEAVARELLAQHELGSAVNSAAAKWISENLDQRAIANRHLEIAQKEQEARVQQRREDQAAAIREMREKSEERARQMQREHDERVAQMRESREQQAAKRKELASREAQPSRSLNPARPKPARKSHEERVKEMREQHQARAAEMKASHEERVRQMRERRLQR